ncbi:putative aromatic di-alanine and TPR containing protein [Rhizoctonia solani 123E]|uniref:Putative aromatic di-alanine and TPR containing protein n=1 Tax=Rhizoctonia solani 123E TaxID=1423351 RepID=A0A074RTB4_9AGAM|nr:putative aromatic di-alanine and TPR containing protein [Rhizoctonia solani 123E]
MVRLVLACQYNRITQILLVSNPGNPKGTHESELHESPSDFFERLKHTVDNEIREIRENMDDPSDAANLIDSDIQAFSFSTVSASCHSEYEASGSVNLLERAILCQRQALLLMGNGHKMEPESLGTLGTLLNKRFERLGKLEDLNEAIECFSRGLQLIPENHADRLNYLNNIGLSWWSRFQQLGEEADLARAIEYQTEVAKLAPEDHPNKPAFLGNLGSSWTYRFQLFGNLADLSEAIICQTQAVRLAPAGYTHKPTLLSNAGVLMLYRYNRFGDLTDMNTAIEYGSQAVQLTSEGHFNKPNYLSTLGNSYLYRFERMGDLVDLDKAGECQKQAVQLTPEGDAKEPVRLSDLGGSRLRRYERLGDLGDLDDAIEHQKQAVQLTPEGCISRPDYLSNLGLSCRRRFERLNDPVDVNNAISYGEQAVGLTPEGDIDKPNVLMNLGCSWSSRFERSQRPTDADKAIEYQSRAVQLTPNGHIHKQMYLNNLGHSWGRRFWILGESADLDKAIQCQTQAVEATAKDHLDRPHNLNNLGNSLIYRHERLGSLTDLDKAVDCLKEAVRLTAEGHRDRSDHLHNLGDAYVHRFELLGQRIDLESARDSFKSGAELILTNPETQIRCAQRWATCSTRLGFSPIEAYKRLFDLIPRLVWMGLTIQGRYSIITKINDFTAQAAAWAISIGYFNLAIEWLEEGRSIVWNQILQLRTPFDNLAGVDTGLANRLKEVAYELEGASSRTMAKTPDASTEATPNPDYQAIRHRRLAAQWETLLAEARQLPGFHDFLRPRKVKELIRAATNGPLVIINTHSSRCDALIVFPGHDDVIHVPLDRFSEAKAVECRAQMIALIGHRGDGDKARGVKIRSEDTDMNQLVPLAILWTEVVSPVLDALAITRVRPFHELPHITWCATGALSFLPLHAAGLYDGISPNAFDLMISSYTPTLSALLYHGTRGADPHTGVLTVGQANSPGMSPLPKTVEELAIIKNYTGKIPLKQLDGQIATVDDTLRAMEDHSWVHLACHAVQNRADPSQSAFHLYDGKLTLAAITKRAFKNKGLAFLSACQTATGDDTLPDEATHLAAGMLMAGYPSVIATMWSIMDEDAPKIAEVVYADLMQDGMMDYTNAARALHKAVGKLREKVGLESIGRWAPFIHIGV